MGNGVTSIHLTFRCALRLSPKVREIEGLLFQRDKKARDDGRRPGAMARQDRHIEIVAAQSNALPEAAAGSSFGICCRFNLFSLFMDSICAKADVAVFRLRRARFRLTRRRTRGRNAR